MRLPTWVGLFAVLSWLGLPAASPAVDEVNRIVLRVNDEILTLHDYEQRKAREITAILSDPRLESGQRQEILSRLGREIMHQVFRELLLLSRSKQLGMSVGEADVDDAMRELIKRQNFTGQEELIEALASAGMTLEHLRDNLRRDLTWQQVIGTEVSPKVQVGEEELRAHYRNHADDYRIPERRWLKEIIILDTSDLASDKRLQVAEQIREQLTAGGEIEEILEPYRSSGISTGLIDLDWLRVEELEDSLAEAAWALQPGEYSSPVAARGGYHILHLAGLREAKLQPFTEVQEEILNREKDQRFTKEMRTYFAELERSAYVREDPPLDAVDYRSLTGEFTPEDELEVFRGPVAEPAESPAEGDGDAVDP